MKSSGSYIGIGIVLFLLFSCQSDTAHEKDQLSDILKNHVDSTIEHVYISDLNSCEMCYERLVADFEKHKNQAAILVLSDKKKISLSQIPYFKDIANNKIQILDHPVLYDFLIKGNKDGKIDAIRIDRNQQNIISIHTL